MRCLPASCCVYAAMRVCAVRAGSYIGICVDTDNDREYGFITKIYLGCARGDAFYTLGIVASTHEYGWMVYSRALALGAKG